MILTIILQYIKQINSSVFFPLHGRLITNFKNHLENKTTVKLLIISIHTEQSTFMVATTLYVMYKGF